MYAILISFALAIYSLVLVDFSFMYKEISANNDLLASTQAFYTAEGAVENTLSLIGDNDSTQVNLAFQKEAVQEENKNKEDFLEYGQGIDNSYISRNLVLNHEPLRTAPEIKTYNRELAPRTYLANTSVLNDKAYYGLEPKSAKGFVIREVPPELNFNEINFDFNQKDEASELIFDIFVFPKEGQEINFQDFQSLKDKASKNSIQRISINTLDLPSTAIASNGRLPLTVDLKEIHANYKKSLQISGFQPLENNYIFHFQTLDNKPSHFSLSTFYQGKTVVLPNLMQTIDLIGVTPNGLYQRVKFQREAQEAIAPGLNFVHFSDQNIIK